jgi:hypothetical protein
MDGWAPRNLSGARWFGGRDDRRRPTPGASLAGVLLAGFALMASPGGQTPVVAPACQSSSASLLATPESDVSAARMTLATCVRRDLDEGRWGDAASRIARAQEAGEVLRDRERRPWQALVVRLDATRRVDAGHWSALVDTVLPQEEALPWAGPLVRGVAAARASWARQEPALQDMARAERVRLERLARTAGPLSEAELARLLVQGAIAGAQYEREEMELLLEAAHDLEVRLLAGDESHAPIIRARELEADLLRVTDRYAAAVQRYRDVLVEWPRRVQSRIGLADAYRRLGLISEAEDTLAQARALWAGADAEARSLIR